MMYGGSMGGLYKFIIFTIICIIGLSAAITYGVTKLFGDDGTEITTTKKLQPESIQIRMIDGKVKDTIYTYKID